MNQRIEPQRTPSSTEEKQSFFFSAMTPGVNFINFSYQDAKFCFLYYLGGLGALGGLNVFSCVRRQRQALGGLIHAFAVLGIFIFIILIPSSSHAAVLTGLDQIRDYQQLFANKNVGLIANQTAVNQNGEHIVDIFLNLPAVHLVALFAPEHGAYGQLAAGENFEIESNSRIDIPIYSLYSRTKKPTPDMLKNVDILVYDIQDVGARFYTYIWTLYYAMCAAAENSIPFVVLDRPNPVGNAVEGPRLEEQFSSFVGLLPIPVRHGMTVGELAQLFYGEGWLGENLYLDLTVVPLRNWEHHMWYDETGLEFVAPSPNMPDLTTATIYPGTCLLEGTNVSEGRGTNSPFLLFGAPWIKSEDLCEHLNDLNLAGVQFKAAEFIPISLLGKAPNPKYKNVQCFGARIVIKNRDELDAFSTGVAIIKALFDLYPNNFRFRHDAYFDKLAGTEKIRKAIEAGQSFETIQNLWLADVEIFTSLKRKYCIYPE